ncbi:hypothetical protein QCA50_008197 [Cerrena zonata]|uniref:Uncharacterized protein n=1 Tax=Cerrena zonata TaxID=2478898 RepID=A0AAW0GFC5_9APHY
MAASRSGIWRICQAGLKIVSSVSGIITPIGQTVLRVYPKTILPLQEKAQYGMKKGILTFIRAIGWPIAPSLPDYRHAMAIIETGIISHIGRKITALMLHLYYLLREPQTFFDGTQDWLLCNLTKHEYIRADAIVGLCGITKNKHGPFFGNRLTFGSVLVTHISWSQDSTLNTPFTEHELHRGEWAGNRIEIIATDKLNNPSEWNDISENAVLRMDGLWKGEFGRDWQNDPDNL